MSSDDKTTMGGGAEWFETTRWTDILDARTSDPARRRGAVGAVVAQYWKPVYAYLRRSGNDNEQAKDLTQGFFQDVVLGRDLIQQADREKGRFRTLLLTALDRYATSVHRAEMARKRIPTGGLMSLSGTDAPDIPAPVDTTAPAAVFTYTWASQLLDDVLAAVESSCNESGQDKHWQVFRRTVVDPALTGVEPLSLSELCEELSIESETKASNMNTTVKRKFKTLLRAYVRQSVNSDGEIDDEIRELMRILSKQRAGA